MNKNQNKIERIRVKGYYKHVHTKLNGKDVLKKVYIKPIMRIAR